jgi:hypothetical protein
MILDDAKIENSRFEMAQFSKYLQFDDEEQNWCMITDGEIPLAIALIKNNHPYDEYYYISEI